MLISASTVLTMTGPPLSPGSVRIEEDKITEVASSLTPQEGEKHISLENHVLLPGLINAHCHLDYTRFKGTIFPGKGFSEWLKHVNALRRNLSEEEYQASILEGFDLLMKSGCTTVLNILVFPDLIFHLAPPPIRTWWFLELTDLRERFSEDHVLAGALHFFDDHPNWLGGFGLSPHSPYTASIDLYRLAKKCSQKFEMPYTTHIAESLEEQEMFLNGRGPLYDFLKSIGRDMSDCGQGSALSHLFEYHVLTPETIAAHMNYLNEYDYTLLRKNPLHVVHCPKCHAFFEHQRFPLERLQEAGCNICIGTDSLASNDTLDLRAEIRQARPFYENISPKEWIEMATINPAKSLGLSKKLGVIAPGAFADLTAFSLGENFEGNPYEAVIESTEEPALFMVNGAVKNPKGS